jgi:hypothetical protein
MLIGATAINASDLPNEVMSNLRMIFEAEKCGISPLDQKMQVDHQI